MRAWKPAPGYYQVVWGSYPPISRHGPLPMAQVIEYCATDFQVTGSIPVINYTCVHATFHAHIACLDLIN